ncbi:MAG: malonyl CoA-acyl carrier protein transacylase [Glaciecola sp.]|jgi:malonyl CoA-acyl carrier protein transacylase
MAQVKQKQRVVVICPGRGTYNKEDLGYLHRLHPDKMDIVESIDAYRKEKRQVSIQSLDTAEQFNMRSHTAGENASALIYACAISDFQSINEDEYEVVAVTGNSMGWYIALAAAGALNRQSAIELINTMGSMMTDGVIGGQMIYPIMDEFWVPDQQALDATEQALVDVNEIEDCEAYVSIKLGGYVVFGGNKKGLKALEKALPKVQDRYPMNLFNHAAFHTPLLNETSAKAKSILPSTLFTAPNVPLIDGLGQIWQPYSCNAQELYDYTLGTQVVETYDFTKAVEVAIKEFAPDKLIVLGPGATLGGAVAQSLIQHNWLGLQNKKGFISLQKADPFILAMGLEDQRKMVI